MDEFTDLPAHLARIEDRRGVLERRLEDGWTRIDGAAMAGEDVERWETFWIDLLREYEAICDECEDLAA
jgi:hypothetical protein